MQGNDRTILLVIPAIALLLAFYFMVLGPKRSESSQLDEDIATLQQQIDAQEQTATYAEQARQDFPKYYGRLVTLGKAVPEQADSASLLVQINGVAERSDILFKRLELSSTGSADPATSAAPATAPTTPAPTEGGTTPETTAPPAGDPAASGATGTDPTAVPTTAVPATETAAANLPIGATVGTAGLPTLPYTLEFDGGYFEIADFFAGVDNLVDLKTEDKENLTAAGPSVSANGRLITIDGFVLKSPTDGPSPELKSALAVTTYITPPEQGLTGGTSPASPPTLAPPVPGTTTTSTVAP